MAKKYKISQPSYHQFIPLSIHVMWFILLIIKIQVLLINYYLSLFSVLLSNIYNIIWSNKHSQLLSIIIFNNIFNTLSRDLFFMPIHFFHSKYVTKTNQHIKIFFFLHPTTYTLKNCFDDFFYKSFFMKKLYFFFKYLIINLGKFITVLLG